LITLSAIRLNQYMAFLLPDNCAFRTLRMATFNQPKQSNIFGISAAI